MSILHWVNILLQVIQIFAVIAGFWIAGTFLPGLVSFFNIRATRPYRPIPVVRIMLWIALSTLFTFPMIDFLSWIGNLFRITITTPDQFSTPLGTVPLQVYSALPFVLLTFVYLVVIVVSQSFLSQPGEFNWTQRLLLILATASLVYRGIYNTISQVFNLLSPLSNVQRNFGVPGFLIELLVGVILLMVILFSINQILPESTKSSEK